MAADAHGTHGEIPASGLAPAARPRVEATLVAPVTLGQPHWQRRYARAIRAVDAGAVGCFPGLYLLWDHLVRVPLLAAVLSVVVLAVAGRCTLRVGLHQLRRHGHAMSTVLAVGGLDSVAALVDRTRRTPGLGWRVTGACTPTGAGPDGATAVAGVPVIGDLDSVASLALVDEVDAVAVSPAPGWTAVRLQHLAWDLDYSRTALLVEPRLLTRTGPHVRVRGVNGLPLVRVDHAGLRPVARFVKGTADRLGASLALLVVAPVLLACAIAVRRDGGAVLHRRICLGRGGRELALLTFRTAAAGSGRPTRVGRFLHRHCLDELPQLFNVVGGSMAIVGPRPLAPHELAGDRVARRRLLIKPGITGLWQIDERTSAADAAPDVRYIAEWSPALDVRILVTTIRAALSSADAHRAGQ
ncbi:sugar transferase [Pseudonocardia charpentierae]|uniref:Sugar transferase n=1 Tax=Pseudonocardia charpentierae TaxID=3075545 RepID=A0ABU2NJC5_9PSEU|nr:sugar transferase [Pseudonocardia sp. DSM 45834]MDT0353518.1 sugar transferase [Pseudonocardia sp. DSM 45834]